ncbi:hypothetical protein [Actinomadura harenae]|uniref:hypothetical protein n=1 Tax=Actinomadura harenae TaxID=2483351 RepID=UPI00361DE9F7
MGAVVVVSPADAVTETRTRFQDFGVSREQVDAEHDEVTFTGVVVTDEAAPRPVGDALVAIHCVRDCVTFDEVGKAYADAEGRFSLTGHLDSGGYYAAQYYSYRQPQYKDSRSPLVKVTAGAKVPAVVTLDALPAALDYGTKVAYAGRVRRQDGRPLAGKWVQLAECQTGYVCDYWNVRTDADGRFRSNTVALKPVWVDASISSGLYSTDSGVDPTIRYSVRYETRVTDLNLRLAAKWSGWVEADVRVERKTTRWEPYADAYDAVALYFRPKGGKTWTRKNGCESPDAGGWIRRCIAPAPGDGDWQARVALTDGTRPSVSAMRGMTMRIRRGSRCSTPRLSPSAREGRSSSPAACPGCDPTGWTPMGCPRRSAGARSCSPFRHAAPRSGAISAADGPTGTAGSAPGSRRGATAPGALRSPGTGGYSPTRPVITSTFADRLFGSGWRRLSGPGLCRRSVRL